ncbi:MAG: hypothetical protein HZA51_02600 [Planctomycetes bacterium]|nr:hypothetical protein [Planctomycetota bacterium]
MPLRYKCGHCSRELHLDDAFRGVGCRCQHCRAYMRVPAAPQPAVRPSARPAHPPLVSAASPARYVSHAAGATHPRSAGWKSFAGKRNLIAAGLVLLLSGGGYVAHALFGGSAPSPERIADQASQRPSIVHGDKSGLAKSAHLNAAGNPTYFGVPVEGSVVAFVVDSDPAMAPYLSQLSSLTNSVGQALALADRRFGIVKPEMRSRFTLLDVAERTPVLEGAETRLSPQLPEERTDFVQSLSVAANWYADQVFLVVAKPLDAAQMEQLTQSAEQTGAITHVIALGPAAQQDLSTIARATGGVFVPVTDSELTEFVSDSN